MKKIFFNILKIGLGFYILICFLLFVFQEKLIFYPQKFSPDKQYVFDQKFEEFNIKTSEDKILNAVLFKADSSKGVIFYLHGNAGSIENWSRVAKTYTDLNYDVFMPDYPGYGKSEGKIKSQKQFFDAVQSAYDRLKEIRPEDKIIVLGYSIGTGPAAKIAAENHPKLLILQAPYYSLTDMMQHTYPIIPTFILKYKFETNLYLKECKMPVVIFHGNEDEVIYYGSSLKLQKEFKPGDRLITLKGQSHNGMTENQGYKIEIQKILNQ